MKKIGIGIFAIYMAYIGAAHAYEGGTYEGVTLEYDLPTRSDSFMPYTYSQSTEPRWFLTTDYLYWYVCESGLPFGPLTLVEAETQTGKKIGLLHQETHHPKFEWNSGVRVGTGYAFCDNWSVSAYWTYIYAKAHKSIGWNGFTHWQMNYNDLDIRLEKEFQSCDALYCGSVTTLTPYVGIRTAWIRQKQHTHTAALLQAFECDELLDIQQSNRSKYIGAGPELGLNFEWFFCSGWSLYGNVAGSVLFGRFDLSHREENSDSIDVYVSKCKKHRNPCQPIFDAALGVRWRWCFCEGNELLFQLGAERHQVFNQNQLTHWGDLYLEGITLGLGLSF